MRKLKQILFLFTFCSMVLLSREFGRNNYGENWPTQKLLKATEVYDLFYKTENFDPNQFFINQTL
jgi:hypothetical protein